MRVVVSKRSMSIIQPNAFSKDVARAYKTQGLNAIGICSLNSDVEIALYYKETPHRDYNWGCDSLDEGFNLPEDEVFQAV